MRILVTGGPGFVGSSRALVIKRECPSREVVAIPGSGGVDEMALAPILG
jgi:nucleoside-diphosphate-sugar epimerase